MYRNFAIREWVAANPGGSENQFKAYWGSLPATEKKVRMLLALLFMPVVYLIVLHLFNCLTEVHSYGEGSSEFHAS